MNIIGLIDEFWKECDDANFSKEATVLFHFLVKVYRDRGEEEIKMHPAKLLSMVKGFNQQSVIAASEELRDRGMVSYTPATEHCSSGVYRFLRENPFAKIRRKPTTKSETTNSTPNSIKTDKKS